MSHSDYSPMSYETRDYESSWVQYCWKDSNWSSGSSQRATLAENTWMRPMLMYLFIDRIPNLLVAFPREFLPYFWESRTPSLFPTRSPDGPGPLSLPPSTSQVSALAWGTHSQGSRGKRKVDEKKKSIKINWLQWAWGKWWVTSYISYSQRPKYTVANSV